MIPVLNMLEYLHIPLDTLSGEMSRVTDIPGRAFYQSQGYKHGRTRNAPWSGSNSDRGSQMNNRLSSGRLLEPILAESGILSSLKISWKIIMR